MVLAVFGLLAGLLLPALAANKVRVQRLACLNNVRQTSFGFRVWAYHNADQYPWNLPATQGGTSNAPDWADHFRVCSNELGTLRILRCPADATRKTATHWGRASGEANISYFVGTTACEKQPQSLLLGDSHVTGDGNGLELVWRKLAGSPIDAAWTPKRHFREGNLALAEGSVHPTKTETLRAQIRAILAGEATEVVLSKPRGHP